MYKLFLLNIIILNTTLKISLYNLFIKFCLCAIPNDLQFGRILYTFIVFEFVCTDEINVPT